MSYFETKNLSFIFINFWFDREKVIRFSISIKHFILPLLFDIVIGVIKLIFSENVMKFFFSIRISFTTNLRDTFAIFSNVCLNCRLIHISVPPKRLTNFINLVDFCNHFSKIFIKFLSHQNFKLFFMRFSVFLF